MLAVVTGSRIIVKQEREIVRVRIERSSEAKINGRPGGYEVAIVDDR
jgi:hypothetical protein